MCIQLLTDHHRHHPSLHLHPLLSHNGGDQVTIAVPDVGEDANGQPHHHLVGEKPRYDQDDDDQLSPIFTFGKLSQPSMDHSLTSLVFRVLLRKPPLKKSKVPLKYQVPTHLYSLQHPLAKITNHNCFAFLNIQRLSQSLLLVCRALKG